MSSLKSNAHSAVKSMSFVTSGSRFINILSSALLLTVVNIFQPCFAQVFPARPVSFIVPFAVGSSTDIMTRLLVKGLNERLNTSFFIVEDKPGASGIVGASYVAKAKPDGYTLLVTTGTTHAQNPWLFKQLSYSPMADFDAVAGIGGVPLLATYLINTNPKIINKVTPIIAIIFTPLVFINLSIYVVALISKGKYPHHDRNLLLIYNALLIGVLALIFFSVAEIEKNKKRSRKHFEKFF